MNITDDQRSKPGFVETDSLAEGVVEVNPGHDLVSVGHDGVGPTARLDPKRVGMTDGTGKRQILTK